jgi:TolB-like protein
MANVALAALAPLLPLVSLTAQTPARGPTLAVMYFNNGAIGARDEYEPLRVGMADILITELQANPRIVVVERDAIQKILEEQNLVTQQRTDPATSARLGKILGAQHMILGGFVIDPSGRMRIDARAVNVETSQVEHVETAEGRTDDILAVVSNLARKLNDGLRLPARPQTPPPPPPPEAKQQTDPQRARVSPFKAIQTYARALTEDTGKNRAAALALYRQFLDEAPVTYAVAQRKYSENRIRVLAGGTE